MKVIKKVLIIALFIMQSIQFFAKSQNVLDFKEIQRHALDSMKQSDGSLIFDGKKDYLKMNNPAYNQEAMAIYMKFRLTSSSFLNKTLELINTADGEVESGSSNATWGLSVNYTKDGLWVVSYDDMQGEMTHNFTKFRFIPGTLYELYVYLDGKNIRIYVDGKCVSEKRLSYSYYNAHNLYVGAGVLKDSYSAMQVYDFEMYAGIQDKEESERFSLKSNVISANKSVLLLKDLQPFVRSKQEFTKDLEMKNGKCLTLINPMKKSSSFGAYFDFTFNAKTQLLKNTLEFFNTTDSMAEIMGKWGLSLNYDCNGLSLLTSDGINIVKIKTGVFFRENERYSMFVYVDSNDIYIYVNGKCVKRTVNTNTFYNDATYLHVGAGVLVDSYVPMTLHDFKLTNKLLENKKEIDEMLVSLMTYEDEKLNTIVMKEDKKDDFSFQIKNRENYILAGAIVSYAVSAVAFTFIPVTFGIYGYNDFLYKENASKYRKAIYQDELDLYYKEMECSSRNANAALVSGIALIPVCAVTLTSGIILTVVYQKFKMEHLPKVAFGFIPNQGCTIQFSVPLKG